jgi:ribosome-interacting GTPase 1
MEGAIEQWFLQLVMNADAVLLVLDAASPSVLDELELVREQLAQNRILLGNAPAKHEPEGEVRISVKKTLVVANKSDLNPPKEAMKLLSESLWSGAILVPFSVNEQSAIVRLKMQLFDLLRLVRIYTKAPGKKPDLDKPFVLQRGNTILDVAALVHKDFKANLKSARIWGSGAFDGQYVQRDHVVKDKDIIELHL